MTLTLAQKAAFTRLMDAGIRRSAELLGKMSDTKWGIMASSLNEISAVRLLSWFHRDGGTYLGARVASKTDLSMEFLVMFPDKSSKVVTAAVTKPHTRRLEKLPELLKLTIGEVSNILAQGIIGVVADELGRTIFLSAPKVISGTKAGVLSAALDDYDGRKDMLLMAHMDLYSENLSAECSVVVIAETESLRRILSR